MEAVGIVLVAVIVLTLVGVAVYFGHKAEQERIAALRLIASDHGWAFDPSSDRHHDDVYGCFPIFTQGHSRRAYNTISGAHTVNGATHRVRMGDYLYRVTRSNGKTTTTTTHRLSYLIVQLSYPGVPDMLIRPEHLFDKIGAAIGFDDIDFESAEFSRRFLVKSADKRFAYDVVTPRMMEFLMASPGRSVDLKRGMICVTDGVKRWKPEAFLTHLSWISGFVELWPEHVVRGLDAGRV